MQNLLAQQIRYEREKRKDEAHQQAYANDIAAIARLREEVRMLDSNPAGAGYYGTVYDGGLLLLDELQYPLIIDLTTASAIVSKEGTQPALLDHDASKPLGHHRIRIGLQEIIVRDGVFSVDNEHSRKVISEHGDGITKWEASVRGKSEHTRLLHPGQRERINGREWDGPLAVAAGMRIREVSMTKRGSNRAEGDQPATRLHIVH